MSEILLKPLKAGLIGAGIQASLTPAMHMREGGAQAWLTGTELAPFAEIEGEAAVWRVSGGHVERIS